MLAQLQDVPADFIKNLLLLGVGLLAGLGGATGFLKRKRTIEPQPLEVRESHEFARERDCMARANQLEKEIEAIRTERIQDMKDAAHSRKALYAQIDSVRKELSDKIDCMPDRVIATLRNFGAIGKHE